MIELSDAAVFKMGKIITSQYWAMIHLRQKLSAAENTNYILLFCIGILVGLIIWGRR